MYKLRTSKALVPTDKHNELRCQKINPQNQPTGKHGSHEKDNVNVEASSNKRAAIHQITVRTSTLQSVHEEHPAETLQLTTLSSLFMCELMYWKQGCV